VGRARGTTVRIPSAEVSRQHCRLWQEGGLLYVEDLDSVNGTFLNSERLRERHVVRPGDRLDVGPVTFVLEYELTPEALARLRGDAVVEPLEGFEAMAEVVEVEEDPDLAAAALEPIELDFDFERKPWGMGEGDDPPTRKHGSNKRP
jgi:pSer/pThr/pTyr-binding forkhead associated (FHA) protein